MASGRVTLVLGGARSGKSRLAQQAAEALPGPHVYCATAQALDAEMAERIARHRADRDQRWRTVECPIDLPAAIARERGAVLLVDCLTLWLSTLLLGGRDTGAASDALVAALRGATAPIFLVSNEVGQGIVPDNPLARTFRDEAGRLNQRVAAAAEAVLLVVAGLALPLK